MTEAQRWTYSDFYLTMGLILKFHTTSVLSCLIFELITQQDTQDVLEKLCETFKATFMGLGG